MEANAEIPFLDTLTSRTPDIGYIWVIGCIENLPVLIDTFIQLLTITWHKSKPIHRVKESLVKTTSFRRKRVKPKLMRGTATTWMLRIKHVRRLNTFRNTNQEDNNQRAFLPYVKEIIDKFNNILKKCGIKTVFHPHKKLEQFLKTKSEYRSIWRSLQNSVQLRKDFSLYIGQTWRLIFKRVQVHVRHTC